jgi:hypothetical protein
MTRRARAPAVKTKHLDFAINRIIILVSEWNALGSDASVAVVKPCVDQVKREK